MSFGNENVKNRAVYCMREKNVTYREIKILFISSSPK